MNAPMYLGLFQQRKRLIYRGIRGEDSEFGHTFGSSIGYEGLAPGGRQPSLHVLFRLNTSDPGVGIELQSAKWLPLICAIRFGACDVTYRVVSDSKIEILNLESKAWKGFPYPDYPKKLAPEPVSLRRYAYNADKPLDVLFYGGILGYRALTAKQFDNVIDFVKRKKLWDSRIDGSPEEYVRKNDRPFSQGAPDSACRNPACKRHGKKGAMRTFALFQEATERLKVLWGPCCDLQIIYQFCPTCQAIHTTNQCD
jgi:hypothetical protein